MTVNSFRLSVKEKKPQDLMQFLVWLIQIPKKKV